MSEPLNEDTEEAWLTFLNRFDREIYPTLFASRGYTKAEAAVMWHLARIEASVDALTEKLEAGGEFSD